MASRGVIYHALPVAPGRNELRPYVDNRYIWTNFYTRDHLGSIREITNSSGTVIARYDYDPYGKMTQVYGSTLAPPFGYAGYFPCHSNPAESGLNLTGPDGHGAPTIRASDAGLPAIRRGRPAREAGGQNLYGYVGGNPSNAVDPWGLRLIFSNQGNYSNLVQKSLDRIASTERGKALILQLENMSYPIRIVPPEKCRGRSHSTNTPPHKKGTMPKGANICWDPNEWAYYNDMFGGTEPSIMPPTGILAH